MFDLTEDLQSALYDKFGNDWQHDLQISVGAQRLYCLVHLAETAIDDRSHGKSDHESAEIAQWTQSCERLIEQVKASLSERSRRRS